jgi:hypothetical protein
MLCAFRTDLANRLSVMHMEAKSGFGKPWNTGPGFEVVSQLPRLRCALVLRTACGEGGIGFSPAWSEAERWVWDQLDIPSRL